MRPEGEQNHLTLDASAIQSELLAMLQRNASQGEFTGMLARVEANVHDAAQSSLLIGNIRAAVAVREQQTVQQRRERGLLVVLETAHDLTAIRDVELVLQAIVQRARQIFASDIGYLTNYDRVRNDFYIRATDGVISERFKNVRVPLGHGICGHVFRNKMPYHSTSYLLDQGFAHDDQIDLAIKDEGVKSLLGAPLMVGNQCIGVLCICDRQVRAYAPWEVSMLATLAAQASVAIENARLFQEAQVALQQASEANDQLHRQAQEIEAAANAHEQMTKLVARGCSVTDILAMVARLLGGHVALLDEAERLMHLVTPDAGATEASPLQALLVETKVEDEVHRALSQSRISGRSQRAWHDDRGCIWVAALMGADRLIGAMAIHRPDDMSDTQLRTFERGALVSGVVLLSQERTELASSTEAAATIRALVSWQQEGASALQARLEPHGINWQAPLRMLALAVEERHIEYALRRLRSQGLPSGVLMEECDGLIVAIAGDERWAAVSQVVRSAVLTDPKLQAIGVESSVQQRLDEWPRAFAALKRGIGILRILGRRGEIVAESSLALYGLLFEQRQAGDVAGFVENTAGALLAHDAKRRSELSDTLLTYLENGYNAKLTSDMLCIHINTLRQRLESIDALLGDWRSGGRALELHMALRLQKLRRGLARNLVGREE
jgi:DNA-binding PucR family transcriptional regulator